jgi:hypothetical protein
MVARSLSEESSDKSSYFKEGSHLASNARVERAPPPAAFDVDFDLDVALARVERALLPAAFDFDLVLDLAFDVDLDLARMTTGKGTISIVPQPVQRKRTWPQPLGRERCQTRPSIRRVFAATVPD